jgi:hypothetical protein
MNFVHLVVKYIFTSKAGCSENCLKFKMPKVPKLRYSIDFLKKIERSVSLILGILGILDHFRHSFTRLYQLVISRG